MSSVVEKWNEDGATNHKHSQSLLARAAIRVWRHKLGKFGIFIITGIIVAAVFAPLVSPHDPAHVFHT